jgi:hypothetical protein
VFLSGPGMLFVFFKVVVATVILFTKNIFLFAGLSFHFFFVILEEEVENKNLSFLPSPSALRRHSEKDVEQILLHVEEDDEEEKGKIDDEADWV